MDFIISRGVELLDAETPIQMATADALPIRPPGWSCRRSATRRGVERSILPGPSAEHFRRLAHEA